MSPVFIIRVWWCTLLIAASGVKAHDTKLNKASSRNEREPDLRHASAARPSCVISIPEDEADGLTKLLNGFLNVFAKTDPAAVDSSRDAGSSFVLDCDNGVSGLETSIWRILNRVWLATSCQYSDKEFNQALLEVENEADKVLITLRNVDMVPFNGTVKIDYYDSTVATVRTTLIQAVEKMKDAQNSGRCHSSAVKQLTANFEEALREIKSQKETIAVLQEETRQALAAISTLKDQTEKSLLAVKSQKAEAGALLVSKQAEKDSEQAELLEKLNAYVLPAEFNSTEIPILEEMSTVATPLTALQVYLNSGFAGLTGKSLNIENEHYKGDFLYLARNPRNRTANVYFDGATLAVGEDKLRERAFQWEFLPVPGEDDSIVYLRNKLNELQPMASKKDENGRFNYIQMRTVFSPTVGEPSQLVIAMKATIWNEYYFPYSTPNIKSELIGREIGWSTATNYPGRKWIVSLASETFSSTVQPPQKFDSTVASLPEEASTFDPPTALQAYLSAGLAGLTGKPLNIENEHYKGEFLYLARNATNRSANVYFDGATLAVGEAELRGSAYQWEFVGVPGEDSSVVYLRNKLNELKPIPSREDRWGGWDYVSIKTVSSGTRREPSQLVITMKETVENKHYYRPNPTPNSNSELNGREIGWDLARNYPFTKWIITFAS